MKGEVPMTITKPTELKIFCSVLLYQSVHVLSVNPLRDPSAQSLQKPLAKDLCCCTHVVMVAEGEKQGPFQHMVPRTLYFGESPFELQSHN